MNKTYVGMRLECGANPVMVWHQGDGHRKTSYPLDCRWDLRNHSPDGFNWGYGGSGPAQLALAILADYLGNDDTAQQHYQNFKWDVIANLPGDANFVLSSKTIDAWLSSREIWNYTQGGGE